MSAYDNHLVCGKALEAVLQDIHGDQQRQKHDGVTGVTINRYATCSAEATKAAKTATLTVGTPTLEAGLRVIVKFTNANTADNPTLDVNSTGAKSIYYDGTVIGTGAEKTLLSGVCELLYDGSSWHLLGKTLALTNDEIDVLWNAV